MMDTILDLAVGAALLIAWCLVVATGGVLVVAWVSFLVKLLEM